MATLTEADMIRQGYTREHAHNYVARAMAAETRAEHEAARERQAAELEQARQAAELAAKPTAAEVRAWAKAESVPCPERGKIPGIVLSAYEAAH